MKEKELNASDIRKLMLRNYRRFSSGEISESRAVKENIMLGNILKAFHAEETEKRLQAIEETLQETKIYYEYEDE